MEEYILEKYKEFEFKEIQSGYRCKTYLISKDDKKYIYQIYFGQTKYQANKKEYITKLIKEKMEINTKSRAFGLRISIKGAIRIRIWPAISSVFLPRTTKTEQAEWSSTIISLL